VQWSHSLIDRLVRDSSICKRELKSRRRKLLIIIGIGGHIKSSIVIYNSLVAGLYSFSLALVLLTFAAAHIKELRPIFSMSLDVKVVSRSST